MGLHAWIHAKKGSGATNWPDVWGKDSSRQTQHSEEREELHDLTSPLLSAMRTRAAGRATPNHPPSRKQTQEDTDEEIQVESRHQTSPLRAP